jgi:hypothetical protein
VVVTSPSTATELSEAIGKATKSTARATWAAAAAAAVSAATAAVTLAAISGQLDADTTGHCLEYRTFVIERLDDGWSTTQITAVLTAQPGGGEDLEDLEDLVESCGITVKRIAAEHP